MVCRSYQSVCAASGAGQIPFTTLGPGAGFTDANGNNPGLTHIGWDWYIPFSRHSDFPFGSPLCLPEHPGCSGHYTSVP